MSCTCCTCFGMCFYNCLAPQPVSTSSAAVCAAECSTIGTPCTINSLVSSGFSSLQALVGCKPKTPAKTAVSAQPQAGAAASTNTIYMWLAVAALGLLAFWFLGRKK